MKRVVYILENNDILNIGIFLERYASIERCSFSENFKNASNMNIGAIMIIAEYREDFVNYEESLPILYVDAITNSLFNTAEDNTINLESLLDWKYVHDKPKTINKLILLNKDFLYEDIVLSWSPIRDIGKKKYGILENVLRDKSSVKYNEIF